MAHSTEKVWSLYRRPLQIKHELHEFNVYGFIILMAAIAGVFDLIQRKLDEQGNALYLPSFAPTREEQARITGFEIDSSGYFAPKEPTEATTEQPLLGVPDIETLRGMPAGSALPPAPPAQPMGGTAAPMTYTISQELLQRIIQHGGGLGEDGCLAQPLQSAQAFVYPPPPGTTTAIAQVKGTTQTVIFRFEADQVMCIQEAKG